MTKAHLFPQKYQLFTAEMRIVLTGHPRAGIDLEFQLFGDLFDDRLVAIGDAAKDLAGRRQLDTRCDDTRDALGQEFWCDTGDGLGQRDNIAAASAPQGRMIA